MQSQRLFSVQPAVNLMGVVIPVKQETLQDLVPGLPLEVVPVRIVFLEFWIRQEEASMFSKLGSEVRFGGVGRDVLREGYQTHV
jgi:hypothetical protein